MGRLTLRRIASGLVVLLIIGFISFLAQDISLHSRFNQPAPLTEMVQQAWDDSVTLWSEMAKGNLGLYNPQRPWAYWGDRSAALSEMLPKLVFNSLALLLLSMLLGGIVGGLIGMAAAASSSRRTSLILLICSVVGISAPSFFLGMLLQYLEITFYKTTGIRLVPVGGFGWDEHLVLPVMVLAARPVAQIARLTYVRVSQVLAEDYTRTARAKGLRQRIIWGIHIVPNIAATVLTAMGTSLRFSLSSLPVVEFLFGWPGAGQAMLEMLSTMQRAPATLVIVAMGALFVAINVLLDLAYRWIDPRLRESESHILGHTDPFRWLASLLIGALRRIAGLMQPLAIALCPGRHAFGVPASRAKGDDPAKELAPAPLSSDPAEVADRTLSSNGLTEDAATVYRRARRQAWVRAMTSNPALLIGLPLGLLLLVLVVAGPSLAPHNPFAFQWTFRIGEQVVSPPLSPSSAFLLGTDAQGRDILSLILYGARRTLSIAFLAVLARLLVGGVLGFLAGWFANSRLDRVILGAAEVLAAFPSLLMAMLIVYAVGIRQGIKAFVIALAIVGWGEVMQTVRSQVIEIKPMAYIESAVATGLSEGQILIGHVLPNVWPTMMSLAFLEMGGVLMLLGELGFLGVFIGGGMAAEGDSRPTVFYYDVPEWSVMLANSWRSFRSYPWSMLSPAMAFFTAILGFTFLGEGLRELTQRLTLSMRKLFNRYTLGAVVLLALAATGLMRSNSYYAAHASTARAFNAPRAIDDVRYLAGPEMNGRLSGSADADRSADWIANQFEALGLQPSGDAIDDYFQRFQGYYRDYDGVPALTLYGPEGQAIAARWGIDCTSEVDPYQVGGIAEGDVVLVAWRSSGIMAYMASAAAAAFGITVEDVERQDRIILRLTEESAEALWALGYSGRMTLSMDPIASYRMELLSGEPKSVDAIKPNIVLHRDLVERILASSGYALDGLMARVRAGKETLYIPTGWHAKIEVPSIRRDQGVEARNVLGLWPGHDLLMNNEVVIVSAYYDGLGVSPDGTLYPGANDNASGVATMLEMVRTLKEGGYMPKRNILFVAWCGGERHEPVDLDYFMQANPAMAENWEIVGAIELEGVAAGTGDSAVLWRGTRERLSDVIRRAARQVDAPLTTRELGLHADPEMWPAPALDTPSATLSWVGADDLAHSPNDTVENLDVKKLEHVGRTAALSVMVLAADPAY